MTFPRVTSVMAVFRISTLIVLFLIAAGCGSKTPNPAPAPAPTDPNPVPTNPTTGPLPYPIPSTGSQCALQTPTGGLLSQSPYTGTLRSVYPHSYAGGNLSISLGFSQVYSYDTVIRSIVGAGSISITDPTHSLSTSTTSTAGNFCVSSASSNGTQQGQTHSRDMSLWLNLVGPFLSGATSGYSGASLSGANMGGVQVTIGGRPDCSAYLYQNKIAGCVDVWLSHSLLSTRYRFISQ